MYFILEEFAMHVLLMCPGAFEQTKGLRRSHVPGNRIRFGRVSARHPFESYCLAVWSSVLLVLCVLLDGLSPKMTYIHVYMFVRLRVTMYASLSDTVICCCFVDQRGCILFNGQMYLRATKFVLALNREHETS